MSKLSITHFQKTTLLALMVLVFACTKDAQNTKAELIKHTVSADEHPIALWEKRAENPSEAILLVHGRTWSALPDFDLQVEDEELSLMEGLVDAGYAVYAIDLRGYGDTPRDETGWNTPDRTSKDLAIILAWIDKQQDWLVKPHLFGWSMGSTLSQLVAQRHPELISSLTLFGYWYDCDQVIPPDQEDIELQNIVNTAEAAASDFITPGSISQKGIAAYVDMALTADPIKADWRNLDNYNELDPEKINIPCLIIQGEYDPIGPTEKQAKLYKRLGTSHKQWITVPGGDHAAFMETPRPYFIHALVSFLRGITEVK